MDGNCMAKGVIYRAEEVEDNGTTSTYMGLTGNTFKERYYGHSSSFRHRDEEHSTTLSSHIWQLKYQNKNYNLKWRIIDRGRKFNPINRKCNLCIKEKYHIIFQLALTGGQNCFLPVGIDGSSYWRIYRADRNFNLV